MKRLGIFAVLLLTEAAALAQGTIPGLTSTPITFSGHADAFVAGPDGNVWLVDSTANAIGRLAVDGSAYQAFPVPAPSAGLQGITVGPDGNLWFTETSAAQVGRITTSGTITEFPVPTAFHFVFPVLVATGSIASGPDGNLWISGENQMARVTPQGAVTVVTLPLPQGIFTLSIGKCVVGSDNNFWCQSADNTTTHHTAKLTTSGAVTLYDGQGQSFDFIKGPDGNVWYVSQQQPFIPPFSLTRITPAGVETVYALPTQRDSEGLAVGADGNIWFTERTTAGNLWQMILSSATDDGHATFNSAPITTSYPEGLISVSSSSGASGIHTEQASPSCSAGDAFYVGTSAEYGENLTWCKTPSPTTCTDLAASLLLLRFGGSPGSNVNKGSALCSDAEDSHDPAVNAVLKVQLPAGSILGSIDKGPLLGHSWAGCTPAPAAGANGPSFTCSADVAKKDYKIAWFYGNFQAGEFVVTCTSDTAEEHPGDNSASGLLKVGQIVTEQDPVSIAHSRYSPF